MGLLQFYKLQDTRHGRAAEHLQRAASRARVSADAAQSGNGGSFAYAIAAGGADNATLGPNTVSGARFSAAASAACIGGSQAPPTPQSFVGFRYSMASPTLSGPWDRDAPVSFLICMSASCAAGVADRAVSTRYGTPYKNPNDKTVGCAASNC